MLSNSNLDANAQQAAPSVTASPDRAQILIVDDSRTSLLKLKAAVQNMGHDTARAEDGPSALKLLSNQSFDLVLLDIVMPSMSGFDVLKAMKADPGTAQIPVVVISATNDDGSSVAQAIELGADDFLPKDFHPFVFKVRVRASVEPKRFRGLEIEYLKQVTRLSQAAEVLEAGSFNPKNLDLVDIVGRHDGLGKLAKVFVSMAEKIYERERKFRKTIARLDHSYHLSGLALVMLAAALGATVGVASQLVPHDLAVPDEVYGFARTAMAGPALLVFALLSGGISNVMPRQDSLRQFLVFGVCCAVFQVGLFRSFSLIGVTITVFLTVCLPPIIAVAWSAWRSVEPVSRHIVSAMLMALVGLIAFSSTEASTGAGLEMLLGLAFTLAAGLAFLFLREILSPWEFMGCVMLFFAMLTLWLDEKPSEDDDPALAASETAQMRGGS